MFAIGTVASNADDVFQKTKETIVSIIDKYGANNLHYAVIFFGNDAETIVDFENYTTSEQVKRLLADSRRMSGGPALDEALKMAIGVFKSLGAREDARKVLVVITDKKSASLSDRVRSEANMLEDMDVKVIPVGIGSEIDRPELEEITPNISDVIATSTLDKPGQLGEEIMVKVLKGMTLPFCPLNPLLIISPGDFHLYDDLFINVSACGTVNYNGTRYTSITN